MKIIERTIDKDIRISSNLVNKKLCLLDIETTGLSRSKDSIYLIGPAFYDDLGNWRIVQLFAEELAEEADILFEAYRILDGFDMIVNYNGSTFDIPFINEKLNFYKTDFSLDLDKSLDLYKIIRANKNILGLKNYRLETVEEYLGIYRKDKYSGKDCIKFYADYLISKDSQALENILLHNYEDIYYLLDVIEIINILEAKKTFTLRHKDRDNSFTIDIMDQNKDYLSIRGFLERNNIGYTKYFGDNFQVIIGKDNTFEISLEVMKGMITPTEACIFIRIADFCLPKSNYRNGPYKPPRGIILLSVENNYYIENIKLVISSLIEKTLE